MSILVQQQGLPGDRFMISSIKRGRTCEGAVNIHCKSSNGNVTWSQNLPPVGPPRGLFLARKKTHHIVRPRL